nr:hypothetical protein [Enterobacteria phage Nil3]
MSVQGGESLLII